MDFISKDEALRIDIKVVVASIIKHLQENEITSLVIVYRTDGEIFTKGHCGKFICEAIGMLEAAKLDLLLALDHE